MKSRIGFIFLTLIIILGVFLRFYKLPTNFIFDSDQGDDMFKLVEIKDAIVNREFNKLPLIGESGTDKTGAEMPTGNYAVYTGVFFLYFILPIAWLVNFSPVGLTVFFALLNLVSIPFVYLSGKELLNKRAGYFAAILFATSYWMNAFSRVIWTPSPVPFFVAISLYLMILIKKGQNNIWPWFLFSISALSQMHDSGYFYSFLFLVLIVILKLPKPKKTSVFTASIISFIIPILPTIIYEISTNFRFVKRLLELGSVHAGNLNVLGLFTSFWNFWITVINPWQYNTFLIDVYGVLGIVATVLVFVGCAISLVLGIFILQNRSDLRKILLTFLITIFALPFMMKQFYSDPNLGLVLSGSVFSLVGAMPFIFIWHAVVLEYFWSKGGITRYITILVLLTAVFVNILFLEKNIWTRILDPRFSYGDKVKITMDLKNNVGDKNYSLDFIDIDKSGSREFLYLFDYYKVSQPVYFKGRKDAKSSFIDYVLLPGEPDVSYLIINRLGLTRIEPPAGYKLVGESGDLRLYLADPHFIR